MQSHSAVKDNTVATQLCIFADKMLVVCLLPSSVLSPALSCPV